MSRVATKQLKIELRVNEEQKSLIERAALVRHLKTSQFILSGILPEAERVVEESEHIHLSKADASDLLARLSEEPRPLAGLRDLFAKPSRFRGR